MKLNIVLVCLGLSALSLTIIFVIHGGSVTTGAAKKIKSYEDVNIIDKNIRFQPIASG